jgi:hypothetical protein
VAAGSAGTARGAAALCNARYATKEKRVRTPFRAAGIRRIAGTFHAPVEWQALGRSRIARIAPYTASAAPFFVPAQRF